MADGCDWQVHCSPIFRFRDGGLGGNRNSRLRQPRQLLLVSPSPARPARPHSVPLMTHLVSLRLIMVMLPVSNVSTLPAVRYTLTAAGKVPCLIWNESKDLHASFEAPSKHRPCLKLKVEPLSWTLLSTRSQATRRLCLNITFVLCPFHW